MNDEKKAALLDLLSQMQMLMSEDDSPDLDKEPKDKPSLQDIAMGTEDDEEDMDSEEDEGEMDSEGEGLKPISVEEMIEFMRDRPQGKITGMKVDILGKNLKGPSCDSKGILKKALKLKVRGKR